MKKLLLPLFCLVLLNSVAHADKASDKSLKVRTVDMNEIFQGYYKMQDAQKIFQDSVSRAQEELRAMVEGVEKMGKEYAEFVESEGKKLKEKLDSETLSEDAKKKLLEEAEKKRGSMASALNEKKIQANEFRQRTDQMLAEKKNALISMNTKEMTDAVERISKKENIDFVLNTAGPAVIYSKDSVSITGAVLEELNRDMPKKSGDSPRTKK